MGVSGTTQVISCKLLGSIEKLDYVLSCIIVSQPTLTMILKYASEVLSDGIIEIISTTIISLLRQVVDPVASSCSHLQYLDDGEYQKIVYEWSGSKEYVESQDSIHAVFEKICEREKERVAIVFNNSAFTYDEINRRSNQLARYIRDNSIVAPDSLVALCVDRSENMIIGILAVLKAGGAYVPIDPEAPEERIKYIINDTASVMVLTNKEHATRIRILCDNIEVVSIDSDNIQGQLKNKDSTNLSVMVQGNNLAYVIYTSGTTGKPKGVMVEHRNVTRLLSSTFNWFKFSIDDVWILTHSYVFDFSVWEIWGSLLYGGKLIIPSVEDYKDFEQLVSICHDHQVTVLNHTPSAFYQFIDVVLNRDVFDIQLLKSLRYVIFGGEKLTPIKLLPWTQRYGYNSPLLVNMYGITETTVHVSYKVITPVDLNLQSDIGRVIPDLTGYVLDKTLNPLPVGAVGELYVGGSGVARGYLNRTDLTAERFIANPFQTALERESGYNSRLYKTGDLVRWLEDGNLEYIGRNDSQVKIRGYRIEIGEIEYVLQSYDGIKQSAVIVKESRNETEDSSTKYLVGYYVSDHQLDVDSLINYLSNKLPDYMVPKHLIHMEMLPLTVNGKLDVKALPEPEMRDGVGYVAPRNEIENSLCSIWSEVLGIPLEEVGIYDDFFKLGGDSIVSIQLVSKVRQKLSIIITTKDIFTYKNIAKLYDQVISRKVNDAECSILSEQGVLEGEFGLLPIQEWFFVQKFENIHHWNQSFMIRTTALNEEKLLNCLKDLITYHDSLRMRYVKGNNGEYTQKYIKTTEDLVMHVLDIRELGLDLPLSEKLEQQFTLWQSSFDLVDGPIFSVAYIKGYDDHSARIWFALHHLIIDTVSWRILLYDLYSLYQGNALGSKGTSYRQWINLVENYSANHPEEIEYWQSLLHKYDNVGHSWNTSSTVHYNQISLDVETTNLLLTKSNTAYHTQINDILLSALVYALEGISQIKEHHIVLEGHGREEIVSDIDITRTVGWFTTMYPVRLEVCDSIAETIKAIKESLRAIPNKGIGYGSIIGYRGYDLPKISFNYLGQFDKNTSLSDKASVWHIVEEATGESIAKENAISNIINVNGLIIDGQLKFNISTYLSFEETNVLSQEFLSALQSIILHTTEQDRSWLTVSDVEYIISQQYLDRIQTTREVEGVYLANSLQQGFIHHSLMQGNLDDAYIVQIIFEYHNALDVELLKQAWISAQKKFATLRMRFAWDKELVQIIDSVGQLDWHYVDISSKSAEEQSTRIDDIKNTDRANRYQLDKGNLFRVWVIKSAKELYTCVFSSHHIILDGWSLPILLDYINKTYVSLIAGKKPNITSDKSYVAAQLYLQSNIDHARPFWNTRIGSLSERSDLSGLLRSDMRHIKISNYKHVRVPKDRVININGDLYDQLKLYSTQHGVTLNAIFQYVWHKILYIYGNSSQTIVGTTVSGRNLPIDNIEDSVGLYINTLPLIVDHKVNNAVLSQIRSIQDEINNINSNSHIGSVQLIV